MLIRRTEAHTRHYGDRREIGGTAEKRDRE